MRQDFMDKKSDFVLIVCYLVGLLCGGFMLRLQMTSASNQAAQLIEGQFAGLSEVGGSLTDLFRFGLQICFPILIWMGIIAVLGLWMVGLPFEMLLFWILGLQCGCFGIWLLQKEGGLWFSLLWFVPLAAAGFLILLPVGAAAIRFSMRMGRRQLPQAVSMAEAGSDFCYTSSRADLHSYMLLLLRQGFLLLLLAAIAAGCYQWYGRGYFSLL